MCIHSFSPQPGWKGRPDGKMTSTKVLKWINKTQVHICDKKYRYWCQLLLIQCWSSVFQDMGPVYTVQTSNIEFSKWTSSKNDRTLISHSNLAGTTRHSTQVVRVIFVHLYSTWCGFFITNLLTLESSADWVILVVNTPTSRHLLNLCANMHMFTVAIMFAA